MPCASLELCSLVGLAGGQVAPCRGQMGCGCGGPSFLEVRKDAGDWNVEDELSDCRRPCQYLFLFSMWTFYPGPIEVRDFPGGLVVKTLCFQCSRPQGFPGGSASKNPSAMWEIKPRFDPWVRKIP